jgi:hypothetical protein
LKKITNCSCYQNKKLNLVNPGTIRPPWRPRGHVGNLKSCPNVPPPRPRNVPTPSFSPHGDNMSDSQPMGCGQILTSSGFRHYDWTLTFDISDILIGWRQNCRVLF